MSTHKKPVQYKKKENNTKLSQMYSQGIFSYGLKNEFETAVVNETSVFEPLKFYLSYIKEYSLLHFLKLMICKSPIF